MRQRRNDRQPQPMQLVRLSRNRSVRLRQQLPGLQRLRAGLRADELNQLATRILGPRYEKPQSRAEQRFWFHYDFRVVEISKSPANFGLGKPHLAQRFVHFGDGVVAFALDTFRFDVLVAEYFACGVSVVRSAVETKVLDRCRSVERERIAMLDS